MGKPRGNVETGERVFCVVELSHSYKGPDAGITVYMSRAGHSDVMTKTWKAPHGMLTSDQVRDLGGWLQANAMYWTINFVGCQEMLPVV